MVIESICEFKRAQPFKPYGKMILSSAMLAATAGLLWSEDKPPAAKPTKPPPAQASVPATNVVPASGYPVIGSLETRGRTIVIMAGPKGTVYSVKDAQGKVLFENVSAEQLRAQAPELHEFIKNSVAGAGGAGGAVDARVRARADARN